MLYPPEKIREMFADLKRDFPDLGPGAENTCMAYKRRLIAIQTRCNHAGALSNKDYPQIDALVFCCEICELEVVYVADIWTQIKAKRNKVVPVSFLESAPNMPEEVCW